MYFIEKTPNDILNHITLNVNKSYKIKFDMKIRDKDKTH